MSAESPQSTASTRASSQPTDEAAPVEAGYRWPAEWEPHAGTWVAWPHNPATWFGGHREAVEQFVDFIQCLAHFEPVEVLAGTGAAFAEAERCLGSTPRVTLHPIATNDAWCRDYGPIFLTREGSDGGDAPPLAAVDGRFNSWGGKYPPFDLDDRAAARIIEHVGCRPYRVDFILEGGALEGNGQGLVMTTPSCLLNANRNPGWQRETLERQLARLLGARKVIWLPGSELPGDDTDGHIDQLARFVGPRSVVAAVERDTDAEHYRLLRENVALLRDATDQDGQPLEVVELPLPQPKYFAGQRLPASYCNFLIANGAVLVPQFNDPADRLALEVIGSSMPDREAVPVESLHLVLGLGSLHCLTQQQPATRRGGP